MCDAVRTVIYGLKYHKPSFYKWEGPAISNICCSYVGQK